MTEQKASLNKIVSFMQEENDWVKSFEASSIGTYLPEDAMWNYKDAPHLNYVHSLAMGCQALISDNHVAALHTQKILGIKFPMTLVEYQSAPNELIYFSTILLFTILVNTKIIKENDSTVVTTNYYIAGPWFCRYIYFLLKKLILNNYKVLMSEDLPMRDRKAQLRQNNYSFSHDNTDHSWINSNKIYQNNVIVPRESYSYVIDLNVEAVIDGEYFYGKNGFFGFRLIKKSNIFTIFQRICMHEGACIDKQKVNTNGLIECPWHARKIKPIAIFDVDSTYVTSDSDFIKIHKDRNLLTVNIINKEKNYE